MVHTGAVRMAFGRNHTTLPNLQHLMCEKSNYRNRAVAALCNGVTKIDNSSRRTSGCGRAPPKPTLNDPLIPTR